MTTRTDPALAAESDRASAPEIAPPDPSRSAFASAPDTVQWHHAAFCRLGLPVSPGTVAWRREAMGSAIRIEPGKPGETLPDGPGLRLVLAHLCDSALRAGAPTVALGADATALAARMGLSEGAAAPLAEQVERLLATRIAVAVEDGPELAVLDARSRPRGGGWPAQLKLNARFLASLAEHAVPLDRAILRALSATGEAMDAHGWTRDSLARAGDADVVTTPWPQLQARFGQPEETPEAFREAFEGALRQVFEADLSIELAVDDDGVSVRRAVPAAKVPVVEAPAVPAEPVAAAPVVVPVAEPPAVPVESPRGSAVPEASPHEPRMREERPREDRQREDRPREDRVREDRPREDRAPRDERRRRDEGGEGQGDQIMDDMIRIRSHLTGLPQVVWLRRGHGDENILVGVTPGTRLDTERLTILMVEPIVMQVSGGLGGGDFERVSAWVMANRDLIDEFWEGDIASAEEVMRRVRKAPGPTWR